MADELRKNFQADVDLLKSKGGVFEVTVDGKLLFSKKELGRFPEPGEVVKLLKK